MQDRLLQYGLLSAHRAAASKPLYEHVGDYRADLLAKGSKADYADLVALRLHQVLDVSKIALWSDITPSRVRFAIDRIRRHKKPLKAQTRNHFVAAVKSFCNWMVSEGRAESSPVDGKKLSKITVTDAKQRRPGTPNELRRIITAAANGPDHHWGGGQGRLAERPCRIVGPQRALLYRLAAETGLRASELASLRPASFKLGSLPYTVTAECGYTKNKTTTPIPLTEDTAALLRDYFRFKLPTGAAQAFPVPVDRNGKPQTARMLRRDCEAAGVDYVDAQGRVLDFHALRHTFITNVANSGASVRTTQELARHSTPTLTIGRYAHTDDEQKRAAINALPDIQPLDADARKTGTNEADWSSGCPDSGGRQRPITPRTGIAGAADGAARGQEDEAQDKSKKELTVKSGEGGIRTLGTENTPYDGLANRCLKPLGHLSGRVRARGGPGATRGAGAIVCIGRRLGSF